MSRMTDRKRNRLLLFVALCLALLMAFLASGCGAQKNKNEISGLTLIKTDKNEDATQYHISRYRNKKGQDGYACLSFSDGNRYLLIPKGGAIPDELKGDVDAKQSHGGYTRTKDGLIILKQPLENLYLAASGAMSHFVVLHAMSDLLFTGTRQNDWYIGEAKAAMADGSLLFAGKYSEPDYESLLKYKTSLAIENTMILHTPDVKEKLETVGIPVMIDLSSYETTPLGRAEWIKVYGVLLGKEKEADAFFKAQKKQIQAVSKEKSTGLTVAFFYLDSQGRAVVRKSGDYIPKIIRMAGGSYIFKDLKSQNPSSHSGTVTMSLEKFYQDAADADVLIYNAAIESPIKSVADLTRKNALFKKFKAVRDDRVWCSEPSMYQASDSTAQIIEDFHKAFTGSTDTTYLKKLQ